MTAPHRPSTVGPDALLGREALSGARGSRGVNRGDSVTQSLIREQGLGFQKRVRAACDYYREASEAVIAECPPPVVGGQGRARYTGKGEVDFIGHVQGRPIAFDAKSTITEYLHLEQPKLRRMGRSNTFRRAGGTVHQAAFLLGWLRCGLVAYDGREPLAFFLVEDPNLHVAHIVYGWSNLLTLGDGKRLRLRKPSPDAPGGIEFLFPVVREAPLAEIGRGRPAYDFLATLRSEGLLR